MANKSESETPVTDEDVPVCAKLRTKALHVHGRKAQDLRCTSRSTYYHCALTQFVSGPDGVLCVPEECQPGRGCFVGG